MCVIDSILRIPVRHTLITSWSESETNGIVQHWLTMGYGLLIWTFGWGVWPIEGSHYLDTTIINKSEFEMPWKCVGVLHLIFKHITITQTFASLSHREWQRLHWSYQIWKPFINHDVPKPGFCYHAFDIVTKMPVWQLVTDSLICVQDLSNRPALF